MTTTAMDKPIRSTIPARLDRLRWSPFHTRLARPLTEVPGPREAADEEAARQRRAGATGS